jgi:hypothetical protein
VVQRTLSECRQLIECWNQRLTLKNPRLTERYIKRELVIIIQFRLPVRPFDTKQLCAIFQREREPIGIGTDSPFHRKRSFSTKSPHLGSGIIGAIQICHAYQYRKPVFFKNIEFVELDESVIPSTVWLEFSDDAYSVCLGSIYPFKSQGFKFLKALENRKAAQSANGTSVSLNQMADQMIKRRPQIMDYLSNNDGEAKGQGLVDSEPKDPITGLRIVLVRRLARPLAHNPFRISREKRYGATTCTC